MIDRRSFCFDIHHTISIKFYNQVNKIGPCCIAEHRDLDSTDIQQIDQHDFLLHLRQKNLEKHIIPDACRTCSQKESSGLESRRSNHLRYYSDDELSRPGVRMLDLHLPNLCNLKCVICGPHDSSSWISDAKRLGWTILPEWNYKKEIGTKIKNLSIPKTVETIKFWGGEPLLDSAHLDVLELAQQQQILQNQRLIYNTNATIKVDAKILNIWSQAKLLELYFSIDDIGERSDYQRSGSKWAQLQDNLNWYRDNLPDNHMCYVSCSYSWLNIWNLPRVIDWHAENFYQSRFGDPIELIFNQVHGVCAITKINPEFFRALEIRYKGYPALEKILHSFTIEPGYRPLDFLSYTRKLDQIRGTDYASVFEEYLLL